MHRFVCVSVCVYLSVCVCVCVVDRKWGRNVKVILKTFKMSALEDNLQLFLFTFSQSRCESQCSLMLAQRCSAWDL